MFRLFTEKQLSPYYQVPRRNKGLFVSTKLYTDAMNHSGGWSKWNKIIDHLYLGKIPYATECDEIIELVSESGGNLGLIVSVVDYFELAGSLFLKSIATPSHWANKNIRQESLPMQDFKADVMDACVLKSLFVMRDAIRSGQSVYVHCKAGRARSVMFCAIYLALFDANFSVMSDAAEAVASAVLFIKSKRGHIGIEQSKIDIAVRIVKNLRSRSGENTPANVIDQQPALIAAVPDNIDTYLASPVAKLAITEMTSFKELVIYAAYHDAQFFGVTDRSETIRAMMRLICEATDAQWYRDYQDPQSVFQLLAQANPWIVVGSSLQGDAMARKKLVDDFHKEVKEHLDSLGLIQSPTPPLTFSRP